MTLCNVNLFIVAGNIFSPSRMIEFFVLSIVLRAVSPAKNWAPPFMAIISGQGLH